ncbi:MAG: NAD(P)/FAD-dependent oxidoreductase [Myxococcaceae bacterium]
MTDFDAVVIGSGAGGLTTALALARAGQKVTVLEQHYAPGGWTHSFALDGFRFSPGVHYLGELCEGGALRQTLEGLGLGPALTFFQLNPRGYDHVRSPGQHFDYPAGKAALLEALFERFPDERKGIAEVVGLLEAVRNELSEISNTKGFLELLTLPYRTRHMGRYGGWSLKKILDPRVKDPIARGVLSVQCGDHGLPPSQVPFALHAAVAFHYLEGGWYPMHGGAGIAKAFTRGIERLGGSIQLETRADKILFEGKRAIGVKLADGRELRAKNVISNADPAMTYNKLVGEERLPNGLKKKLAKTKWSTSAVSLYFAVEDDLKAMGFDSGNYWLCPDVDAEVAYKAMQDPKMLERDVLPGMFLSVTTLKDPLAYDGRYHTCEAFILVPYETFAAWEGSLSGSRPADYEALKEKIAAKMFATLESHFPGLTRRVVFKSVGTPLTNKFYCESNRGAIYGTEKTLGQLGPFSFNQTSPFEGLMLCGASTLGHGVHGATLSGLNAAAALLGTKPTELLEKNAAPITTLLADDDRDWPAALKEKIARRSGRVEPKEALRSLPSPAAV